MYDFDFYDLRKIFHVMKYFILFKFLLYNKFGSQPKQCGVTDYGYKLQIKFSFIPIFRENLN